MSNSLYMKYETHMIAVCFLLICCKH